MLAFFCFSVDSAQPEMITLILAVPAPFADVLNADLMKPFEEANPGVQVRIEEIDTSWSPPSPAFDLEGHLSSLREIVTAADVIPVNSYTLSTHATRAGFFLDLSSLIDADSEFIAGDFTEAVLKSFEWDHSTWALPVSADFHILMYNKIFFDRLELEYPHTSWSAEKFNQIIHTLYENNDQVSPFPMFSTIPVMFRALSNYHLSNPDLSPLLPTLSNPNLEVPMSLWDEMNKTGMLGPDNINPLPSETAMFIHTLQSFIQASANDPDLALTLLPQEYVELTAHGFAVSSGTAYPEHAYALVNYLTTQHHLTDLYGDLIPARHAYTDAALQSYPDTISHYPQEYQDFVEQALTHATPSREKLFDDYINLALFNSRYDRVPDLATALQEAQLKAVNDLERAASERSIPVIIPSVPHTTLSIENELTFGIGVWGTGYPNQEVWDQIAYEFVQHDSEIEGIAFDIGFHLPQVLSTRTDCFYLPYNAVPSLNLSTVLNLDPLFDIDASFQSEDFIEEILSQLERENRIWAYPFHIQPYVLQYNVEYFIQHDLPLPDADWNIEKFTNTLTNPPATEVVFAPSNAAAFYLLIAAYGGLPLDFRTMPPEVDVTSRQNVEAIRQVLDLAKNGLIRYPGLAQLNNLAHPFNAPLTDRKINPFDAQPLNQLITFPEGDLYTPVAFDIGAGYITRVSQNPEACYRWFTFLSQHHEFGTMPVRYSQLPVDHFYSTFAEHLTSPNLVVIPLDYNSLNSPVAFPLQTWLNRALDRYVLDDAQLDQELLKMQDLANAYLDCTAVLPTFQTATSLDELSMVAELYSQCALSADPSLSSMLGSD